MSVDTIASWWLAPFYDLLSTKTIAVGATTYQTFNYLRDSLVHFTKSYHNGLCAY